MAVRISEVRIGTPGTASREETRSHILTKIFSAALLAHGGAAATPRQAALYLTSLC
ncbi:MAG: hypothetical protein ACM30D_05175 [Hyphomicrobiales bacterium]|jgi:hypothetical protein